MRDQEDRSLRREAAQQLGDEVRLPREAVRVVGRLVGKPEAEEVERERGSPPVQLQERTPVVGARRETVQEEQHRLLAVATEDVDRAAERLQTLAALPPPLHSVRHRSGIFVACSSPRPLALWPRSSMGALGT